jgi:hypothetical protein
MAEIEFVQEVPPPKRGGRTGAWRAIADALRARPGQWARVAVYGNRNAAGSLASRINAHKTPFDGDFKAAVRSEGGGSEFAVYARYELDGAVSMTLY